MRNRVSPCNHFSGNFEALCPGSYYLLYTHTPGLIRTGGKISQNITMTASFGLWIKPHNVSMHDVALLLSSFTSHRYIYLYILTYTHHRSNRISIKLCLCFHRNFLGKELTPSIVWFTHYRHFFGYIILTEQNIKELLIYSLLSLPCEKLV